MSRTGPRPSPGEDSERRFERYKLTRHLGKGGFAEVEEYTDTARGVQVAIKRVQKESYRGGANLGAVKELCVLQELQHPNIIGLTDVFVHLDRVHLVLTFCEGGDLTAMIRDRTRHLGEAHVKCIVKQLLDALQFAHHRGFMHRDVKPDNVLLTREGRVQLADFGHATRIPDPDAAAFPGVVTLWYRAPELLLQSPFHGPAVDMWAVGVVLAELLLRQPLFPGRNEADQLAQVIRLLGAPLDPELPAEDEGMTPDAELSAEDVDSVAFGVLSEGVVPHHPEGGERGPVEQAAAGGEGSSAADRSGLPLRHDPSWPGCSLLPGFVPFEERPALPWRDIFPPSLASDTAVDLLSRLLVYDPARRLTASEARRHRWFSVEPSPCAPSDLPLSLAEKSQKA